TEVHRLPIVELERLRYSIKISTSGAPKIRRFQGPIAPAAFDLRQGSCYAPEIVSLLLRESFHRGRVSTKMIKGGVCLP
ncbi:unnamed protein product, partial [Cyprideis torosa]